MAKKSKAKARKPAKARAPKVAKPKAQRLEGMEDMPKIKALDAIAESIADVRERKNECVQEEKSLLQHALRELIKNDTQIYKAHGVELIHVHGDDKVRVRLVSDDNAEGEDEAGTERAAAVSESND